MHRLKQENEGLCTSIDEGNKTSFMKLVPISVGEKQKDERNKEKPRRNKEFQAAIHMAIGKHQSPCQKPAKLAFLTSKTAQPSLHAYKTRIKR